MIAFNLPEEGVHILLYSLEESIGSACNKKFMEKLLRIKMKIEKAMRKHLYISDPKNNKDLPKVNDFRLQDILERLNNMGNKKIW